MNARKLTYITIGTALLLASCAKEEVAPGSLIEDNRIIFRTYLPESTSRAMVVGKEDIPNFHVTAFNPYDPTCMDEYGNLSEFINNELVEKDDYRSLYKSEACLWPEQGREENELTFFAYYPTLNEGVTLENTSTVNGDVASFNYAIKDFLVASNIADQVDFITAYTTGSMVKDMFSGISLNFNHKLSRIEIKAKSSNNSCKLEIAGVRIGGLYQQGTYNFKAGEGAGDWTIDPNQVKENVEYIYRPGDKIVKLDNTTTPESIMGGSDGVNYAMLLPSSYNGWDFTNDSTNSSKGMFISVLLRVLDKTPNGNDKRQYPYHDNSQGPNALNIERIYLAVDNDDVIVDPGELYKGEEDKYYTDSAHTIEYTASQDITVKEFGWAALPVTGSWEAGHYYTYTLDYSHGVGLHDPSVGGSVAPKAGDPIISDRIGVSVSVEEWQVGEASEEKVPGS